MRLCREMRQILLKYFRIIGIYHENSWIGSARMQCYCYVTSMYNILILENRCVIFIMRHG